MPTKVIVFDLWNTLVYDPSKENHEKIARLLGFEDKKEMWGHLEKYFMHKKTSFYDYVKELIRKKKLPKETFNEIEKLWEDCKKYVDIFPDTIKTLDKLKRKYKLALLSNTAVEEGNEIISRFGLKKYFDYIVFSCAVGLSKPDPEIFRLILNHFKIKPEEAVMIGDTLEIDILPAKLLGFKTILVDSKGKYTDCKDEEWCVSSLNELKL